MSARARTGFLLILGLLGALCTSAVDARKKRSPIDAIERKERASMNSLRPSEGPLVAPSVGRGSRAGGAASSPPTDGAALLVHVVISLACAFALLYCVLIANAAAESMAAAHRLTLAALALALVVEAIAHVICPQPQLSVSIATFVSVLFTISPVLGPSRLSALHMGSVPPICVLWLMTIGVLSYEDLVRALYGTDSLRPYHLVVMFLGSVYLCTALERSGFLHTAAVKVVERYGRSPWGLFWALGCFSATLTVLIPDDIVTMTLTPVTIRMCQLLNLPEIPFLFSQFFAGNIWAVTLVTGNPTNVLLAEDLGDTFLSFAGRMGIPGLAAGLTSFALMYWTNRDKVDVRAGHDESPAVERLADGKEEHQLAKASGSSSPSERVFTTKGIFCLIRVLTATTICALEGVHGLPVYFVVLCMGVGSFLLDMLVDVREALDALRHMPWELFSFVTGFLVLAEAMSTTGISRLFASVFVPFAASRNVAFVSGYVTMLFCNVFETLPATLIVFKMIDSVPMWRPEAIAAAGASAHLFRDARRAALSAVIFGSNFGANTACIGSLGGLMMRRLAALQGVTVTNGMLLRQGIPVMIPTMFVACFVLILHPGAL